MDNMILILDSSTRQYSSRELSKALSNVLRGRIAVDFVKQGGKKLRTGMQIKTYHNTLEQGDIFSNIVRKSGEKKNNNNKNNKSNRNNNQRYNKRSFQ